MIAFGHCSRECVMTDLSSSRFEDLCNLLLPLGALNSPAELHGLLCGKLCGGEALSETRWLLDAVEFLDFTQAPDESVRAALSQLYKDALTQLRGEAFELVLILPDDESDIAQRLTALGQWCYGFLSGFGSVAAVGQREMSEESEETLRDLASIAQIDIDVEEDEDIETDYMELTEYIRMAASSLYMEFAPAAPGTAEPQPPTLH